MTATATPGEVAGDRDEDAERSIRDASVAAAALGAVLSPIPFADEIALVPVFAWLTVRVGRAYGLSPRGVPWKPLAKTAVVGLAARAGLNLTVGFIPGVAAVANAATAVALTQLYGTCAENACRDPSSARALGLKEIVAALRVRLTR